MKSSISIIGSGMTQMSRRDRSPEDMALDAARQALSEAGLTPSEVGLVIVANAAGGRLCDQACIKGQTWLRTLGLTGVPVMNVDNSCASGSSALHLGVLAARAGESPVLVLGVEKMWTGDRQASLDGVMDGMPSVEREPLRARLLELELIDPDGSVLMGLNATWLEKQMTERGVTLEQVAATAVKARRAAARNPLAQQRTELTLEQVLAAPRVAGPLTRPMCSSFTDGAAAVVLSAAGATGAPRIIASAMRSGNGDLDYHERLAQSADLAWSMAGVGPADIDVLELHDATSAEEIYALESLGFFKPGDAAPASAAGDTDLGGKAVQVNPSGGLVGRGHPLGATGVAQVVELAQHLQGRAGDRQVDGARLAFSVNSGGIIGGDAGIVAVHILEKA